jgi:hypothetical protein
VQWSTWSKLGECAYQSYDDVTSPTTTPSETRGRLLGLGRPSTWLPKLDLDAQFDVAGETPPHITLHTHTRCILIATSLHLHVRVLIAVALSCIIYPAGAFTDYTHYTDNDPRDEQAGQIYTTAHHSTATPATVHRCT